MGNASRERNPAEKPKMAFRRAVYFVKPMKSGAVITDEHIRRKRPGFVFEPKFYGRLIGKIVIRDVEAGTATIRDRIND